VLNIMAAVSQWEREAIGERTRDAMRHKRSQGERGGQHRARLPSRGDGQHLEPDPPEQAALAEIWNLRRQGHTLRGIATTLNSRGHRTPGNGMAAGIGS
jgi:site-specific DNA recombinase